MAIVFKIRRNTDGLFSMGGSMPSFNKTGKIWKQRGHLTSHLGQLWRGGGNRYDDCEIVPYELIETPAGPGMTIAAYLQEIADRKNKRDEAANQRFEKIKKEQRRQEYEKLQKEFGND